MASFTQSSYLMLKFMKECAFHCQKCVCIKAYVFHMQSLNEDEKLLINFNHFKIYLIRKIPLLKKLLNSLSREYLSMSISFYALASPKLEEVIFRVKTAIKSCKSNT